MESPAYSLRASKFSYQSFSSFVHQSWIQRWALQEKQFEANFKMEQDKFALQKLTKGMNA